MDNLYNRKKHKGRENYQSIFFTQSHAKGAYSTDSENSETETAENQWEIKNNKNSFLKLMELTMSIVSTDKIVK